MNDIAGGLGTPPDAGAKARQTPQEQRRTLEQFLGYIGSEKYAQDLNSAQRKESLFHYTDLGGLIGMVSRHDLWLTNSRFSNDDREILHGYDVARNAVKERIAREGNDEFYAQLLNRLTPEQPEGVYICCFCDKDNLLSQWRGYGANGTGVSVEINPSEFSWVTGSDMALSIGLMRFWKVYYDLERQQNKMVENAIEFGREQLSWQNPALTIEQRANIVADVIEFFIPTFKNKDFSAENEWRLIFTPARNCEVQPDFRVARQMLIPYFSLRKLLKAAAEELYRADDEALKRLPIRRVLMGPNYMGALNVEGAKILLSSSGYPSVEVEKSETPYRGA